MAKRSDAIELASALVLWPIEKLKPYERNARTHSPEQVAKIAQSIEEFGFTNPILVDGDAGIIAGHGRLMAAKRLGLETVPIIELTHLSEAQKRAYVLADNRLAEDAGWDEEMLAAELAALREMELDLELTGFSDEEIDDLLSAETEDFDTEEEVNAGALPQAMQMEPPREYVVIMCDAPDEFEDLKVALGLKPVRRGGYKKGSAFDAVGVDRVIKASAILDLIRDVD
jgi:hypothetical protein